MICARLRKITICRRLFVRNIFITISKKIWLVTPAIPESLEVVLYKAHKRNHAIAMIIV